MAVADDGRDLGETPREVTCEACGYSWCLVADFGNGHAVVACCPRCGMEGAWQLTLVARAE